MNVGWFSNLVAKVILFSFISFCIFQWAYICRQIKTRIFAHHPDQGNWAMQDLDNRMQEPWFDEKGFFLATENGTIEGFVWTKIHQDLINQDPVGELYVVGTHPDHAGKGIARALSVEAINYLVNKGLKHAILYVDADNEKGLKLYGSLGFN